MEPRWKPSVTVAAVIEKDGRFLLVEEHTAEGLRLNNPAGHLDPGESPAQGCVRETLEETAYAFVPDALVGIYLSRFQRPGEDVTYLRFAFSGTLGALHAERSLDKGIVRTLWLSPEEIRAVRAATAARSWCNAWKTTCKENATRWAWCIPTRQYLCRWHYKASNGTERWTHPPSY